MDCITDCHLRAELAVIIGFHLDPLDDKNNTAFIEWLVNFVKEKSGYQTLPPSIIVKLLVLSCKYHRRLPNVIRVNRSHIKSNDTVESGTLTVVGDLHGQFNDLAQIFQDPKLGGYPSETNQFIFNGDLVDRGHMGVEIVVVLMFCILLCPESVHILRGNHETRSTTTKYGFKAEVERKMDPICYSVFMRFFDALPVAAIVDDAVFVTHGGIGSKVVNLTIEDINKVDRFREVRRGSVIWDMLWADPNVSIFYALIHPPRYPFTQADTQSFLERNNLALLIRSHEYKHHGFDRCHGNLCWTVFSAPNYCGRLNNTAAVVRLDQPDLQTARIVRFNAANSENPGVCASFRVRLPIKYADKHRLLLLFSHIVRSCQRHMRCVNMWIADKLQLTWLNFLPYYL